MSDGVLKLLFSRAQIKAAHDLSKDTHYEKKKAVIKAWFGQGMRH